MEKRNPIAVIKPLEEEATPNDKIKNLEVQRYCEGLLRGNCRMSGLLRLPESLCLKPSCNMLYI